MLVRGCGQSWLAVGEEWLKERVRRMMTTSTTISLPSPRADDDVTVAAT